jgi:hypothetical protein
MTDDAQLHSARFATLIISLHTQTMILLGKLADPASGELRRNLNAARGTIDLIDTLAVKTKGNLTPDEDKMIQQMLTELRLNYVEESNKPEKIEEPTETPESSDDDSNDGEKAE